MLRYHEAHLSMQTWRRRRFHLQQCPLCKGRWNDTFIRVPLLQNSSALISVSKIHFKGILLALPWVTTSSRLVLTCVITELTF